MAVAGVCFLGVFAATGRRENSDFQDTLPSRDLAGDVKESLGTVSALSLEREKLPDRVFWDLT